MATRRRGGGGDSDDWFGEVEPPHEPGVLDSDPASAEDDWLLQPTPVRRFFSLFRQADFGLSGIGCS